MVFMICHGFSLLSNGTAKEGKIKISRLAAIYLFSVTLRL
ncbi:hypothetical protein PTUN_a0082 [Pseudoalteromonas tunicata]|nr:hypothetical protein PTUN_a0082 [Pseudoalteromonas tunicata]